MRYAVRRHRDLTVKVYPHPEEALNAMQRNDQLFVGRSLDELRKIFPGDLGEEVEEDVRPEEKKVERRQQPAESPDVARGALARSGRRRSGLGLTEPRRYRNAGGSNP